MGRRIKARTAFRVFRFFASKTSIARAGLLRRWRRCGRGTEGFVQFAKQTYLLTAILACRSVGRTIGNGGLVTTSLTQRASPPLK